MASHIQAKESGVEQLEKAKSKIDPFPVKQKRGRVNLLVLNIHLGQREKPISQTLPGFIPSILLP